MPVAIVSYCNSEKKMRLQTTSNNGEAGRRGEGVWQVVPDTGWGSTE